MDLDKIVLAPLMPHLDFTVETASPTEICVNWVVVPPLHQPTGILHGGVHCTLVEGLASWGASLWLGSRGTVVGVNNNTDFYRAAREGRLRSVAKPIHQGRTSQVWVVETRDGDERLVARGQVRLQHLEMSETTAIASE